MLSNTCYFDAWWIAPYQCMSNVPPHPSWLLYYISAARFKSWLQLKLLSWPRRFLPNTHFHTKLCWHWVAPPMCTFDARPMHPPHLVDCHIRIRLVDWCLMWYIWLIPICFGVLYLVQFCHTHLDADFDGVPMPTRPTRILSCTIHVYIISETNIVVLAIIASLFVRGDEPI